MVAKKVLTLLVMAGVSFCLPLWLGCGSQTDVGKSTEWIQEPVDGQDEASVDVAAVKSSIDRSAFQANDFQVELDETKLAQLQVQYQSDVAGITYQSSPSEVTRAFVHLLHVSDLQTAERLLTLKSRAVIHESGLELSQIAGSRAEYVIGEAQYTTNNKDRAFVDCFVFDPELATPGDAESGKYKITWALRPEARCGWRVFGMISEESGQPQMVSFENTQHAQAINQMYDQPGELGAGQSREAREAGGGAIR
ncbi:MAG: hypothetical protein Q8M16_04685 [Pirellulaceae bacterium]|nr:hypothetical protein [Pirellulaceae bacterium]